MGESPDAKQAPRIRHGDVFERVPANHRQSIRSQDPTADKSAETYLRSQALSLTSSGG